MSRLILIASVGENNIIGRGNEIPWRIPEDMKHFKDLTMGHPVMMGRKTYESIPEKFRPLPGRTNIVVSRHLHDYPQEVLQFQNLEEAIEKSRCLNEVSYIAGGGQIYEQTIGIADQLEITRVYGSNPWVDFATFPKINTNDWMMVSHSEVKTSKYGDKFSFETYVRK